LLKADDRFWLLATFAASQQFGRLRSEADINEQPAELDLWVRAL